MTKNEWLQLGSITLTTFGVSYILTTIVMRVIF